MMKVLVVLIALQLTAIANAVLLKCGKLSYNAEDSSCCLDTILPYPNARLCGWNICYNPATQICKAK